jgi:DNA polymerase
MFHPSYLLRNASRAPGSPKSLTWEDIQKVRKMYDQLLAGEEIDI